MQLTEDTIQRLVDGELDAAEYQDALLALEADPTTCESNAWRRCALTFLESQAFEFGAKSWLEARKRGESGNELNDTETTLVAPIAPPARKFRNDRCRPWSPYRAPAGCWFPNRSRSRTAV